MCDDYFSHIDAVVVCRGLGLTSGTASSTRQVYDDSAGAGSVCNCSSGDYCSVGTSGLDDSSGDVSDESGPSCVPCADVYRIADCSQTDGAADCRTQCFDPSNCTAHTDCGHDGTSDTYCDTARNCYECSYCVNTVNGECHHTPRTTEPPLGDALPDSVAPRLSITP